MTNKIPLKIVLPFLVVTLVVISLMQFGRPNVILLVQSNSSRMTEFSATQTPTPDFSGVMAGGVLSLSSSENKTNSAKGSSHLVSEQSNKSILTAEQLIQYLTGGGTQSKSWDSNCKKSQNKLVFIKTHKTASTTVATIFERYGYEHNLTFALPWVTHIFGENQLFNRDMVMTFADMKTFDMLTNHARLNRREMEAVVPKAKYVSIIRDPVTQFESAFGYFEMAKSLGLAKKPDPLAVFLKNPRKYFRKSFHMKVQSFNGQIYDLGFDHDFHNNTEKVKEYIAKLDQELDLVMLTEYFDESLILLQKLMCWHDTEILYLSKGVRNQKHRYSVSAAIAEEIREWNAADRELYNHFNRTFWQKVSDYGPEFGEDLRRFRQLQRNFTAMCLDTNKEGVADYRETKYAIKKNSPEICNDLERDDLSYVRLIRWGEVRTEFGLPKLLAMIACGLVLLILILTALLFCITKVVQRLCRKGNKISGPSGDKKCKYAKLSQSEV